MRTKTVLAAILIMLVAAFSDQKAQAPAGKPSVAQVASKDSARVKLDTLLKYKTKLAEEVTRAEENTVKLERLSRTLQRQRRILDSALVAIREDSGRFSMRITPLPVRSEVRPDYSVLLDSVVTIPKQGSRTLWDKLLFRKR